MFNKKIIGRGFLVLVICVFSIIITGFSIGIATFASESTSEEKVIRIGLSSDMLTFDTHNYITGQDGVTQNFVFETLVVRDENYNIQPSLATSWKQLSDTEWEFKLRENVFFTDGSKFNSEVVKFNLERGSAAPRGSGFGGFVESVTIIDEFIVVVNLKYPFGPILYNLCNIHTGIQSKAAIEEYGDKITSNPVGTGPYKLVEWVPNDHVYFEQNKNYWGELPAIERIEIVIIPEESSRLMALQLGEIDLIENPPPHEVANIESNPDTILIKAPRFRNVWLGFTRNSEYSSDALNNPLVRKAIQHAIDIDKIVEGILEGLGIPANESGYIPPIVSPTLSPIQINYDIEYAKELLEEAGYKNGLSLRLWTPENRYFRDKQVCEVIQQQLKDIGISIDITVMEWGAYLAALGNHEADLFIMGWGFTTGDAAQALRQTLFTGNTFNFCNYSNSKFDELLSLAEKEADVNKRAEYYQKINELIIIEDAVVVPLYYMYSTYGARSNFTGIQITPDELIDLRKADIN